LISLSADTELVRPEIIDSWIPPAVNKKKSRCCSNACVPFSLSLRGANQNAVQSYLSAALNIAAALVGQLFIMYGGRESLFVFRLLFRMGGRLKGYSRFYGTPERSTVWCARLV